MSDRADRVLALLVRYRRRFRAAGIALALLAGAAAAGAVLGMSMLLSVEASTMRFATAATLVVTAIVVAWGASRRWTLSHTARVIETRAPLHNLLITAEEVVSGRATIRHDRIRDEVLDGAFERLHRIDPPTLQPVRGPIAAAVLSVVAMVGLLIAAPASPRAVVASLRDEGPASLAPLTAGDLRIVITPPAYARRNVSEVVNPTSVSVLEGSRLHLEVIRADAVVVLHELAGRDIPFETSGERAVLELSATTSRPLLIRQVGRTGQSTDRLVHLRVERDERPAVAIREPAKDLVFESGVGEVPLQIEARDDVGLQSLVLRYTRVSGSGETFTFEEGEWPVAIAREGAESWRGQAVLSLQGLKLQDGDTLVYRALARDNKPGADPATSDTYLIEIGRLAGVAAQGFALPEERDRQAISQQMLIIKTERLHAEKSKLTAEAFAEQAQLLAVEQRMVKAEFVFMTGGEVEDEIEEATHGHELAEGRMENAAQVELLTAIREMSRAEARLNSADTGAALEFERAALKALQRAFDRRRYLLRTLPERARIDITRRLTGELDTARSSTIAVEPSPTDPQLENARALLRDLTAAGDATGDLTALAARLLALDGASEQMQNAALQLTRAHDEQTRLIAIQQAQRAIVDALRARMTTQVPMPLTREPLNGRLVQELRPGGSRR